METIIHTNTCLFSLIGSGVVLNWILVCAFGGPFHTILACTVYCSVVDGSPCSVHGPPLF